MTTGKIGNMKSIREIHAIMESQNTLIPLLQRNYKWSRECAAELAEDLWCAYTAKKDTYMLNMITIYRDERHNSYQILDGQQRMITLKLFLELLDPGTMYLNYSFERDDQIDETCSRRYFINSVLPQEQYISADAIPSADILRLRNNYYAMLLPISFKTVYEVFRQCIENNDSCFRERINSEIVTDGIKRYLNTISETEFFFDEEEQGKITSLCESFHRKYLNINADEELSDDEIRISEFSEKFQLIWEEKITSFVKKHELSRITEHYKSKDDFVKYILDNVEMLYHETTSEPIAEFLNINENKTRFVISDYIRANMISDNPIEGSMLSETQIEDNRKNRKEILDLFGSLSAFLYSAKDEMIWNLIKIRYDDFTKNPDRNRLKILFCDKYIGTSTKGYKYEEEIERLRYFNKILRALEKEIGIDSCASQISWNTYNAVYILLECKQKYRFFNLFTKDDINNQTTLDNVTIREKFCFFEQAYLKAKNSDDLWDISYFLESQIYEKKCDVRKSPNLPAKIENEWCQVNRGNENDELHNCLNRIIQKKRSIFNNE